MDQEEPTLDQLRQRLEEAEQTLAAIRNGEVDALLVTSPKGERIYMLEGADHAYRALVESMQQGAVTLSSDGLILYCNPYFSTMVKRPATAVIGAKIDDFVRSEERPTFTRLFREGTLGHSQGELYFQADNGTLLPVLLAFSPLPVADGNKVCMIATDLTGAKAQQQMEETNRRKDEFLAMLSHELRNPLAPIRNAVAILHMIPTPIETVVFARDVIERQVQHMSHLIDDLLDVSRITMGKIHLHQERVELSTIIKRAIETSRP